LEDLFRNQCLVLTGRTCATGQFSPVMTGENKHDDCSKFSPT